MIIIISSSSSSSSFIIIIIASLSGHLSLSSDRLHEETRRNAFSLRVAGGGRAGETSWQK